MAMCEECVEPHVWVYMAIQNNNESKSIHTKQIHKQRSYKMKTKHEKKNSAARQLNSPACIW